MERTRGTRGKTREKGEVEKKDREACNLIRNTEGDEWTGVCFKASPGSPSGDRGQGGHTGRADYEPTKKRMM